MTRTHIPNGDRTLCGRVATDVRCIDMRRDAIDDATCKACGRVDDARSAKQYRRENPEDT